jgi:hypothetical protein
MTQPAEHDQPDAETQLHAGPRDEGGEGGMATRELRAHDAEDAPAEDADRA